jgi:hypothetical protein
MARMHIPQANDLDKVFEVVELVASGEATTAADISDKLDMVPRQGFYYVAAAEGLGLIAHHPHSLVPTSRGIAYAEAEPSHKTALRKGTVLGSDIVKHLAGGRPRSVPPALLDEVAVTKQLMGLGLSAETASRRACTLKAWLETV